MRRYAARFLIIMVAMGCYTWQSPNRMAPERLIAEKHPGSIRVTVQDLARIYLRQPRIEGDSLFGIATFPSGSLRSGDSVAIHVAHISKVEVSTLHGGRTAAAIVGGVLAIGGIALAAAASSMDQTCTVSSGSGY
jgi:hypothetical protein